MLGDNCDSVRTLVPGGTATALLSGNWQMTSVSVSNCQVQRSRAHCQYGKVAELRMGCFSCHCRMTWLAYRRCQIPQQRQQMRS